MDEIRKEFEDYKKEHHAFRVSCGVSLPDKLTEEVNQYVPKLMLKIISFIFITLIASCSVSIKATRQTDVDIKKQNETNK